MLGDVKDEVMSTMALMLAISVVLMTIVLFLVSPVRRRVMSLMVHTNRRNLCPDFLTSYLRHD